MQIRKDSSEYEAENTYLLFDDSSDENVEFEDDITDLVNMKSKEPENGDFALITLSPLNSTQKTLTYIGKIINLTEDNEQLYEVDFYRQSKLMGRFF
ncbi:hypothetical protein AVEN_162621-1 [Araneus ventricosus]|uniref:Uncharacterized protein n=1 Tax=Araneus ventricosus TaxID=182803 RepID=A0A4Y2UKU0_ARAVE|nr:hypothetical protein AVEN_162621-1 [Araneus ventricosus]